MNAKFFLRHSFALLTVCLLAAGCHKNEPPATPASSAAPEHPRIVSAEKNSFDEVTAKLDKGGNLFVYLSTEKALSGLSNGVPVLSNFVAGLPAVQQADRDRVNHILDAFNNFAMSSGVRQISGIGMSSIAREPGFYYGKLVIHHYEGQNSGMIWSLFGSAPHPLETDLLPESTALAVFSDFDLLMAWTNVAQVVAGLDIPGATNALDQAPTGFRQLTGLDLNNVLKSLGGAYGIIMTLDEHKKITVPVPGHPLELPSPGIAIVIKVNSDLIFNRVDEVTKGNVLVTRVDDPDFKMRTMNIPLPLPVDVRPSLARFGDYLVLASSDTLARGIYAVKSGHDKGFAATDEFKKLSQDVPNKGNISALITGAFSRTMLKVHDQFAGQDDPGIHVYRQFLDSNTNSIAYAVVANGPQGWEGFANGNHSLEALVVPAAVAAGTAAAVAIPNLVKAHEAATQPKSQQP